MPIQNTIPKNKQEHFIKLLQSMVNRFGYKETAAIARISQGHVYNILNDPERIMLVDTCQKILAGYKASKHR